MIRFVNLLISILLLTSMNPIHNLFLAILPLLLWFGALKLELSKVMHLFKFGSLQAAGCGLMMQVVLS